jgi:hypothetical protein
MNMKFSIKKHTVVLSRNIYGKAVETTTYYTIDKVWFGLFRIAMKFTSPRGITEPMAILAWEYVNVEYVPLDYATRFRCKELAEEVLQDIKNNPNRYRV